jgi:hypothetical protein
MGFVVRDIDKALQYWTGTLGVGPFYLMRDLVFENYCYRGKPSPTPRVTLAFANSGDMQIELIQQTNDAATAYREFLESGREGFHHVSSWMTRAEYDPAYAAIRRSDVKVLQEGSLPGTGLRFVYYDSDAVPGGVIYEISEANEPPFSEAMTMVRNAARGWDGQNPIRGFS